MATKYTQEIKTSIKYLDYDTACKLIRYVDDCLASIGASDPIKLRIQFDKGDIEVTTDSLKDFKREAYRQNIYVKSISINNKLDNIKVYICFFNGFQKKKYIKFNLSSENTTTLTDMMIGIESRLANNGELLRIQKRPKVNTMPIAKASVNIPIAPIPQSPHNNITINVGRDFNMSGGAIGSNKEVENKGNVTFTTNKGVETARDKSSFWEGVLQQIVANGVWWIIGVIGASILTYLGLA